MIWFAILTEAPWHSSSVKVVPYVAGGMIHLREETHSW